LAISGRLQQRTETKNAKLRIFGTLVATRHDPTQQDTLRSLNLIDVVFADDFNVREAWSAYYAVLSDGNLNNPIGWSIREEKRRALLLEMTRALSLQQKVSLSDILRSYMPSFVGDQTEVTYMKLKIDKAQLTKQMADLGLSDEQSSKP